MYRQCQEPCGCIMAAPLVPKDILGRDCCIICGTPLEDTPRVLEELSIISWEEAKDKPHDGSMVDNPTEYMWYEVYGIYYPMN